MADLMAAGLAAKADRDVVVVLMGKVVLAVPAVLVAGRPAHLRAMPRIRKR